MTDTILALAALIIGAKRDVQRAYTTAEDIARTTLTRGKARWYLGREVAAVAMLWQGPRCELAEVARQLTALGAAGGPQVHLVWLERPEPPLP